MEPAQPITHSFFYYKNAITFIWFRATNTWTAGALTSRATRTMGTVAYQGKVAAPMAETPGTVAPTAAPPVATGQPNVETPKHDAPAQHTMGRIRIERHDDQTPVPIRGTTRAR